MVPRGSGSPANQPSDCLARGRTSALYSVYLRDYWPAQGHFAYYRRLSNPGDCNGSRYIRFAARNRCFLVHRRYRLVTGHSYIVYGPLSNGATQVLYEGTPDTPHRGRWWEIVEKY